MIKIERNENGVGASLSGSVGDLMVEFAVGLGHFLSNIEDKEKRMEALAEIVVTAIDIAVTESGQNSTAISVNGEMLEKMKEIINEMKERENDSI